MLGYHQTSREKEIEKTRRRMAIAVLLYITSLLLLTTPNDNKCMIMGEEDLQITTSLPLIQFSPPEQIVKHWTCKFPMPSDNGSYPACHLIPSTKP
jgi:hypothetical protein